MAAFSVSLLGIGRVLGDVPAAWIADRFGDRRSMLGAAVLAFFCFFICIIANSLRWRKAQVVWQAPILAGCSLHALARWHQRGLLTTPDQLMADLKLLAALAPAAIRLAEAEGLDAHALSLAIRLNR